MVFHLTFNEPKPVVMSGKGPMISINMSMIGDIPVRKACEAIVQEMERMQTRNAYQTFTLMKNAALKIIRTGQGIGLMAPNIGTYARQKKSGGNMEVNFHRDTSYAYGNRRSTVAIEPIPLPYKQSWNARYTEFADETSRDHPLGRLSGELYQGVQQTQSGKPQLYEKFIQEGPRGGMKGKAHRGREDVETNITTVFDKPNYITYVHNGKPGVMARPFFKDATKMIENKVRDVLKTNLSRFSVYKVYEGGEASLRKNPNAPLNFDPLRVYPYFTFELTDSAFTAHAVEIRYNTSRKGASRSSPRGKTKSKKIEDKYGGWKGTYRELSQGSDPWTQANKRKGNNWV